MKLSDFVANQTNETFANELMEKLSVLVEVSEQTYNEERAVFNRMMDNTATDCDDGDDWDDEDGNTCRRARNLIIAFTRTAKRIIDGSRPTDDFYRRHKTKELIDWLMELLKKIERERDSELGWEIVDDDDWER